WPPAHRPRRAVVAALEAHAGLGDGGRGAERHAERGRERGRLVEIAAFLARHALVQRLIRPGMADRILLEEDETLETHFLHADLGRHFYERRQLGQRLLQPGEPGGDTRLVVPPALLQGAEGAHVLEDAAEEI